MKRKYAAIFMLILYVVVMVLSLAACGDDSGEWKSYHKVYRGNDGVWRGADVLYYDEGSSAGEIILVIIVVLVIIIKKVLKAGSNNK